MKSKPIIRALDRSRLNARFRQTIKKWMPRFLFKALRSLALRWRDTRTATRPGSYSAE